MAAPATVAIIRTVNPVRCLWPLCQKLHMTNGARVKNTGPVLPVDLVISVSPSRSK